MKNQRKGVCIICPFYEPNIGGVETHLHDLVEAVRKKHSTYVITYKPLTTRIKNVPKIEEKKNLWVRRIWWPGHSIFHILEPLPLFEFIYLFPPLFLYSFWFILKNRKNIGTIHAHGIVSCLIVGILGSLFHKKKVASIHAIYNLDKRRVMGLLIRATLSPFSKILCLSDASKEELLRIGLPREKLSRFTYWVDQQLFRPINRKECLRRLKLKDKFTVLFVGRLIPIKGVNLVFEASNKLPDISFIIVGDGPLSSEVAKHASKKENTFFVKSVENEKLPAYYNAADILLVPSLYEEGFGRVIIESLSCGTPVIGSKKGGIPEAISENVGILIQPNTKQIISAILSLRNNPKKLAKMRKASRSYALQKFSEKNAEKIMQMYQ